MVKKYIILSEKRWHKKLFNYLKELFNNDEWLLIDNKNDFNFNKLKLFNPYKIFIPHWSYIIPCEIHENYECIVFHMTDLPFGRGGSPLQNLISKGYKKTKITALRVEQTIDGGDFYLKKTLDLAGKASEIFERATYVIKEMICEIIDNKIKPKPQIGKIVEFKRRKPEDSDIAKILDIEKVYDFIRMLDCEGYPQAYIETQNLKFEFFDADFNSKEKIIKANVRIFKK